jgi:hypothetical protein
MAMTACYSNYELTGSQGVSHQTHSQSHHLSSIQQNRLPSSSANAAAGIAATPQQTQKDYSIPLHVDCSVEYELPNQAKPPVGGRVEPLLMIHPCYFRKMESQRRSPFINNMPNPARSSSSALSNLSSSVASSSAISSISSSVSSSNNRRISNVVSSSSSVSKNPNSQILSSAAVAHQNHQIQQQQQHMNQQQQAQPQPQQQNTNYQNHHHHSSHQNLQLDQYVQRQMVHMSQQAQYPVGANIQQNQPQNNNQYMQNNGQNQQISSNATWDRYINVANGNPDILSRLQSTKSNVINQNVYKKSSKRTANNALSATCANTYSNNILEGGLPNGGRWDIEKTSMAAIPRDYQAGPESIPQSHHQINQSQQQQHKNHSTSAVSMYHNQNIVGKRDAMLSGGCSIYNSSNSNPNTDISSLASGLWDQIEKSPMATIPSNYQAGPDSIPNNLNSSCKKQTIVIDNSYENSTSNSTNTANKSINNTGNNNNNNNNNSSNNHRQSGTTYLHQHMHQQQTLLHEPKLNNNSQNNNLLSGKYKQYLRSHRIHPYLMSGNILTSSSSASSAGILTAQNYSVANQFPHLNGAAFSQIQQVSCYNV